MSGVVNNPPGGSSGSHLWPGPDWQDKPACVHIRAASNNAEPAKTTMIWLTQGAKQGDTATYWEYLPAFLDTQTPLPPLMPGESLEIPISLTLNPAILISYGPGRPSTYINRRIRIYRNVGQTNWYGGTVQE